MALTYYHGGPKGLKEILPPSQTNAASMASMNFANNPCRRDRVYVTTSYTAAIMYASTMGKGNGAVYEVVPVNPLPDPDCLEPGLSFEAERAEIIRRIPVKGKHLKLARKALLSGEGEAPLFHGEC